MNKVETARWVALRMRVDQLCPMKVTMGEGGLLCVGVRESNGCPSLVAICDETSPHGGASATNSMEGVLSVLEARWAGTMDVSKSNVIELDSMGQWDAVIPTWRGTMVETVAFKPIKWVGRRASSQEAMLGVFGAMGQAVLDAMETMRFSGCSERYASGDALPVETG